MPGYQTLYQYLQDGENSTGKENMLNMCSKQDLIPITLLVMVALIIELVREFIAHFSL